jgi:hypothetical protein
VSAFEETGLLTAQVRNRKGTQEDLGPTTPHKGRNPGPLSGGVIRSMAHSRDTKSRSTRGHVFGYRQCVSLHRRIGFSAGVDLNSPGLTGTRCRVSGLVVSDMARYRSSAERGFSASTILFFHVLLPDGKPLQTKHFDIAGMYSEPRCRCVERLTGILVSEHVLRPAIAPAAGAVEAD